MAQTRAPDSPLLGVGLYTPAEANRFIGVGSDKLGRWLRGYEAGAQHHEPLWEGQVDGGEELVLGFRDLIQARVASLLIKQGLTLQKVRKAIRLSSEILDTDHPFASAKFRTDGKTLLLQTLSPGEDDKLLDVFSGGQYVMRTIIEPSLKDVDFDDALASRWWPLGKRAGIVLDPDRQFGHPIDATTGVPTRILANAAKVEGSPEKAARAYQVRVLSVLRAITYETQLDA